MSERTGGSPGAPLGTARVAAESGYSLQQVRDLERLGVLPPAVRAANGYRSYSPLHVRALRAYRGLAEAAGPVEARRLLTGVWQGSLADAASALGEVHVRLARERTEAMRAQESLREIAAEEGAGGSGEVATEGATGVCGADGDSMTITELAGALGVRASALRFWEQEGLVTPERVTSLRARRYGPAAVAAARIVVALRGAGHGVPAVREVLGRLREGGGPQETARVLQERLDKIATRTVALLRAGSDLAAVIEAREAEPGSGGR
ncbi:MerR family transcriptional regulator [Streptomyces sp. NPDC091272]|uniref:MerR family transcriptional regulator n=1 Tax=Streptomyces sp. NPDC091272 TaxID=3365981 RepID=UPI00383071C4